MTTPTDLAQALRELAANWRRHADKMYFAAHANRVRECADELDATVAAHESRAQPDRAPDGYAYRYPWHTGGTVIRFSNGEEINGSKPLEAIPFYYWQPPAQPASVGDGFALVPIEPTQTMLDAGMKTGNLDGRNRLAASWQMMIYAAPQPAKESENA